MGSISTSTWEDTLSKATARGANIVPGVVLIAITSNGKELYSKAAGYNGLSPTAPPVTKDATYWIASCTKLLTSISALQCVERGLVTLDEPLEKWLPELSNKPIVSLKDGEVVETPPTTKITLRHLLTHTAGFEYEWASLTLPTWREKNPYSSDPDGFSNVAKFYNVPLSFDPGHGWAYGVSTDWAGILVERLNDNITLGEYFHKNIFGRLGSKAESTSFSLKSPAAKQSHIQERLLTNLHRQEDGTLLEQVFKSPEDPLQNSGGGGLYSSVGDYIQVLQDIISPEPKLLQKQNLEEWLFRGHITNEAALKQFQVTRTSMTPEESGGADQHANFNYALGGAFCEGDVSVLPKGTLTWGGLPNLKWFANREKGVAALFATQLTPFGDQLAQDLATKYFEEVWRIHNESV